MTISPAIAAERAAHAAAQRDALLALLDAHSGAVRRAAAAAGVHAATLRRRLALAGITTEELRERYPLPERQPKRAATKSTDP